MKKIYLLSVAVFLFSVVFAQYKVNPVNFDPNKKTPVELQKDFNNKELLKQIKQHYNSLNQDNKIEKSRWFNYAIDMDNLLQNPGATTGNNLFPDTTILVYYGEDNYSGPWVHGIATVLDPKSDPFEGDTGLTINQWTPYNLDSIGIYHYYVKTLPSATDTIIINVLYNISMTTGMYYFSGMSDNYGIDTVEFKGLEFYHTTGYVKPIGLTVKTFKYPLTYEDTATWGQMSHFLQIATPTVPEIGANKIVGVNVLFKPGYSWTANVDTLSQFNTFQFMSIEENGDAGGDGTFPFYTVGDWNCSHTTTQETKFDATSSWYEFEIPTWAWTIGWGYENHLISFKLRADVNPGINEKQNASNLSQNYPNPFNTTSEIFYELTGNANVMLEVYDVTGQKVYEQNEGKQASGKHAVTFNANTLSKGMYYYTLVVDNSRITKKMIIN